jgi:hypothetical protein
VQKRKGRRSTGQFFEAVCRHFFTDEHGELDYSEFLDLGEKFGLLKQVSYDPGRHGKSIMGDPEPGETIYVRTSR